MRSEVKTVFERAIQRQNGWASTHSGKSDDSASNSLRRSAVVFMDEAGLPEEAKESLKVLHYYLDDPNVAFVAISNRPLDAAKMNRCVLVVMLCAHVAYVPSIRSGISVAHRVCL
jgi:hemicentin